MSDTTKQARENMDKTISALKRDFSSLRTGRANAAILDDITVDYYGVATPISQVAAVKTPEAQLLTIEPWDKSIANAIEKAILASQLGVTPNNDGSGTIRLPFPSPTEERRREIVKDCKDVAERARVAVRNIRRDIKNTLAKQQKDGDLSEDEQRRAEDDLQKVTDEYIGKIDALLKDKEAEVMEI